MKNKDQVHTEESQHYYGNFFKKQPEHKQIGFIVFPNEGKMSNSLLEKILVVVFYCLRISVMLLLDILLDIVNQAFGIGGNK